MGVVSLDDLQKRLASKVDTPFDELSHIGEIDKVTREQTESERVKLDDFFKRKFGIQNFSKYARESIGDFPDRLTFIDAVQSATINVRDITTYIFTEILNAHGIQSQMQVWTFHDDSVNSSDVKKGIYNPHIFEAEENGIVPQLYPSRTVLDRTATIGQIPLNIEAYTASPIYDANINNLLTNIESPKIIDLHNLLRNKVYGAKEAAQYDVSNFFRRCLSDMILFGEPLQVDHLEMYYIASKKGVAKYRQTTIGEFKSMIGYKTSISGDRTEDYVNRIDGYKIRPASSLYYREAPIYLALFDSTRVLAENLNGAGNLLDMAVKASRDIYFASGIRPNVYLTVPYINPSTQGEGIRSTSIPMKLIKDPSLLEVIIDKCKNIEFDRSLYDLYYKIMIEVINMTAE